MPAGSLTQVGADAVAGLLRELSAAQVTSLFEIIEPALPPERVAQLDQLARAAVSATRDGDTGGALAKLATLVSLDPRRGEGLASDPALAPIRKEAEALLARLTDAARPGAETRLREAAEWMQAPEVVDRPIGNVKASTLLLLAGRLIDAGGYANCIHSAKVSQMFLDPRRWAPRKSRRRCPSPWIPAFGIPPATPRIRRDAMAARTQEALAAGASAGAAAGVAGGGSWPAAVWRLCFGTSCRLRPSPCSSRSGRSVSWRWPGSDST